MFGRADPPALIPRNPIQIVRTIRENLTYAKQRFNETKDEQQLATHLNLIAAHANELIEAWQASQQPPPKP